MNAKALAEAREALAPYLDGSERENGDIDAYCPVHKDSRRSAVINFEERVWYCNAEGVGGELDDLMEKRETWQDPPQGASASRTTTKKKAPAQLPTDEDVERWRVALLAEPIALEDIKGARGLWTKTLDYHEIGWDVSTGAYTIPVRDEAGTLVNVRRYQIRPPKDRRKMWGVTGHNGPALYPFSALAKAARDDAPLIVCEGEWDALICNQYNFRAVTRTAAANVWKAEFNRHFKDRVVYVCHDADEAGQKANRKVARALLRVAREVRVVRLPYPILEKGGKDLSDWWADHDGDPQAFRRLLEEAPRFDEADAPEVIDPSPASVVDAFDSRKTGAPLAMTVTIKGRRDPGYTVPRKVEFRCTRDWKPDVCSFCPMNTEDGEMDRVIAGSDPTILELCDSTKPQVDGILRKLTGAPAKCPKLKTRIAEHQSVEILFARPSVEHANGGGSDEYKNIKLMSVGRHDTSPNQTVQVIGALHPDPRKQLNEFLAWDLSKLETSLDRFELGHDDIEALKVFQPRSGQQPLAKLREIADDLSSHVTRIYGRPELHAAIDLTYHSLVGFEFGGKMVARGWLELLVVGDTRTGKSETAVRMSRFYRAGEVVSCESATYAGIMGGLQQFGSNKEWAITWGSIPINDRRLVVLDEVSGLAPENIGAMSSARSSGIAELNKIQQERTHARTRLIWLGNPRNGRMSDYTYGVQAIRPLIGNPEDIARFDFAMSVSSEDVKPSEINREYEDSPQVYGQDACAMLVRWAWSRTPDQVRWADGAQEAVYEAALALGRRYVEDPPLVQSANAREKVARIAVAIAARLFSTDERAEDVIVKKVHVIAAVRFLDRLYNLPGFGYAERSKEVISDRQEAERPANIEAAKLCMRRNPGLDKFMRSQGKFRRQDLEEILDVERDEANAIISELYGLRMLWKEKGDIKLTSTLHRLLREGKL